ncbi:MAG: acetylglutamate kinase [Planctomycetes bacterium]|jgi:acetylglutamate kinase|nr:acetylglutamate kinase [Planctomycetota bacterium]
MIDLFKAAPHIRLHRGATMVIKVGGNALARPANVRQFARQVSILQSLGARVVLVHGGGPQTDAVQRLLGEEPRMVDGRRVTSPVGLRALRMATIGELNCELASVLTSEGAPAVGLCGASAGVLEALRRKPLITSEGVVDFGEVGDLEPANPALLNALLDKGFVPVVAPPAGDGRGGFLNVNADLAAASIAVAMGARKLVLATGAAGILRDVNEPNSLVSALTLADLARMESTGALQGGMKVKAKAMRIALEGGVQRVHVVAGGDPEALLVELYTTQGAGTLVTLEPERAPAEAGTPPVAPVAGGTGVASGAGA